jgi:hypothetical protein
MRRVNTLGDFRRFAETPAGTGFLLAGLGLVVWVGLSVWGGIAVESGFRLGEAWDTKAYFYVGLPLMVSAVALSAFIRPERAWRWPLWLVAGHQVGVLAVGLGMQSGLSLLILTLILAVLLAAFFAIPAMLGSLAARRLGERAY